MEIKIEQVLFSLFRSNYSIYINEKECYYAQSPFFSLPLKPKVSLYNISKKKVLQISCLDPISFDYKIAFDNSDEILFKANDSFKFHYSLNSQSDKYDIYGNQERKYSIYKNERQIAWFEKDNMVDYYKMMANGNVNVELLIAIVLILDIHFHKGNNIVFDFGKIGFNLKPFDEQWIPT